MTIRAIIVDDVPLARDRVRALLAGEDIVVAAECGSGREAVEAIRKFSPDLVFLDIQMPAVDGFEVVSQVGVDLMPAVIFITAYDEFALKAFEVNAIDYLLKPFSPDRFQEAIRRARRNLERGSKGDLETKLRNLLEAVGSERQQFIKRIPVKTSRGTHLINVEDLDWIGAAGHYLELHVGKSTHLIREKLTTMEHKLDPTVFARIHRSTIVNIERIKSFHPLFNGDHLIILKDGRELNLSRTFHERLMSIISN